jgi:cytoskeletal protein CcmA (bactofilin family)
MIKSVKILSALAMLLVGIFLYSCAEQGLVENLSNAAANSLDSRKARVGMLTGIDLGTAENFAILSKSGITNVYPSNIRGDVGTSPITGAALLLTCGEVTGTIYTVAAAGPLPCRVSDPPRLTTAVLDMQAAYTDAAAGRPGTVLNLGAGVIGNQVLSPGVYKWTSTLLISSDIKLKGDDDSTTTDVWIFQVAGTFNMSSATKILLRKGAKAENIFWQVAGAVTLGTTSEFKGTLLGKTSIAVQTGARVKGRLLAQTAVTLQKNIVRRPIIASLPLPPGSNPVQANVDLGQSEDFAILSESGVTNIPSSNITGNVGIRTGAAPTLTCGEVTGTVYTMVAAGSFPCRVHDDLRLTTAVFDMQTAYTNIAGRPSPDVLGLGAGVIGGQTLIPGLYKWASNLVITDNIILDGDSDDVWVFQVSGAFNMSSAAKIILTGGARAKNIFWQVAGAATLGPESRFRGNLLGQTSIAVQTGAIVRGRLLAQTGVTLQSSTVTNPTAIPPLPLNPVQASVDLGQSEEFAILSKSGITNVFPSNITGNVGTSPITGAALLLTCGEVTGTIYTVAAAGPLPCRVPDAPRLTSAVLDMQAAYTNVAGRTSPDVLNLGSGIIGGQTLSPGLYKWTSTLVIATDIVLNGGPNDVWIFQAPGTFNMGSAVKIILTGGAKAENVFWQVAGAVTLGTTSEFRGTLLGKTSIAVQTGAIVEGRLLAQTAVTLQMNTVTNPTAVTSSPPVPTPSPVQARVDLGIAEEFVILSKSGITNVFPSNITGNVGTSPITGAALLLTCGEVTGTIYTVAAAGPLPCRVNNPTLLTPSVLNMQAAYTDAAGRTSPDVLNLGAGVIGGQTLTPGLYKWASTLVIANNIILNGGPNDVWIFQVAGTFNMSSATKIILTGGARAKNVFWQVSGAVTLGTTSEFKGTLLGKTSIAVQTGATVEGRLLAQTAVTLQMNTVTMPF